MTDAENSNEIIATIIEKKNESEPENKLPKRKLSKTAAERYSFLIGQTFTAIALLLIILLFKMFGGSFYSTLRDKYENTFCRSLSPNEIASSAKDVFETVFIEDNSAAASKNSNPETNEKDEASGKVQLTTVGFSGAYSDNISGDEECYDTGSVIIENTLVWPCKGRISDYFGLRADPFTGKTAYHKGIDIAVVTGTEIHATLGGKVTISRYDLTYGNYIVITHSDGIKSLYAHLSERKVNVGDKVNAGDIIALSGNTGSSTGPHLHFEILMGGTNRIDPLSLLPND